MLTYIARRIFIGFFTILAVTCLVYGLIRNMPGTPLTILSENAGARNILDDRQQKEIEKQYHLDKHWIVGYGYWLSNLAQGDLGRGINFSDRRRVTTIIATRLPNTLLLTVTSLLLTYLMCIPMGLFSTAKNATTGERVLSISLYVLYALPTFVAAIYLNLLFAVKLGWLPLSGMTSEYYNELGSFGKAWDILKHIFLPIVCLTYGSLAYYTRFIKANMLEAIQQDYVRTARAKGVSPTKVLVKHAFRNSLIPLVTLIGLTLPALLAGSVILEHIYQWDGIGKLFIEKIGQRDYPVIMGLVLMFSVMTLIGQLLADILYAIVDPRITYS
ncbi:ABC transporter permease [Blastopirellula marina]|uniref:ABC transporter permease n=1 Tax=Blastopirellula marina TaxID=124 RepID=A0A2S8FUG3_9BACT|nr:MULTISPECIES: ABC transporter permease [Pirellulaceae]PQO35812.1 ABC transporter permease [Blastopirellula marina]RCS53387.1 ABC transporter permease [Bremerella cremea]